jgi:phosphate transport system substrate-binding protein
LGGKNEKRPQKPRVTRIAIAGSSAMLPLVTEAANRYMLKHPDIAVDVSAGGSARGVEGVLRQELSVGTSDVVAGSDVTAKLEDHLVAVTGFATMANRGPFNDKIQSLTLAQLKGIFSGTIKNWSEVGGSAQSIVVINRRKGSGTRVNFGNIVLGGDQFVEGLEEESSALVRTMLEQTTGAISYLALSYLRESLVCFSVAGVAPTNENIATGAYPIWSYEHMYTLGPAKGGIKDFLDFMQSTEVQNGIVPSSGFLPIARMHIKASARL